MNSKLFWPDLGSQRIMAIYRDYTDLVEPLSLDEAYLDVTDSEHCEGSATLIAREIRARVAAEVGLTVSAGVAPNKFAFTQKALFAEDEWSLTDAFKLTMGARYDRHSLFGGKLSPRIYGVWNAAPQWTVKGGVSNGYKTPRVEQLAPGINGFGGQGTIPLVGSPGLKPETSTSTELGVYFDSPQGFAASAMLFNNQFKDKITSGPGLLNCSWATTPNRPGCVDFGNWPRVDSFGQSINVDKAVTRGLELSTRYQINAAWGLKGGYTHTRSEVVEAGKKNGQLANTPKHAAHAQVEWQPGDKSRLWFRGEYRGKSPRFTGDVANLTGNNLAIYNAVGDIKAHALFHVGGSYQVSKNLSVQANIYNLFDKDFREFTQVNLNGVPTYVNAYFQGGSSVAGTTLPGRTFWVSANLTF